MSVIWDKEMVHYMIRQFLEARGHGPQREITALDESVMLCGVVAAAMEDAARRGNLRTLIRYIHQVGDGEDELTANQLIMHTCLGDFTLTMEKVGSGE